MISLLASAEKTIDLQAYLTKVAHVLESFENSRCLFDIDVPEEISKLINMQRLILANNMIRRLPMNIGKLQSLKLIMLDGNRLTTLPYEVGQFVRLEWLSISGNLVTSLPETIGSLRNLLLLNISHNKLESLPEYVESCFSLEELQANENSIEDLPISVCSLIPLKSLCLDHNKSVYPNHVMLVEIPVSHTHTTTSMAELLVRVQDEPDLPEGSIIEYNETKGTSKQLAVKRSIICHRIIVT